MDDLPLIYDDLPGFTYQKWWCSVVARPWPRLLLGGWWFGWALRLPWLLGSDHCIPTALGLRKPWQKNDAFLENISRMKIYSTICHEILDAKVEVPRFWTTATWIYRAYSSYIGDHKAPNHWGYETRFWNHTLCFTALTWFLPTWEAQTKQQKVLSKASRNIGGLKHMWFSLSTNSWNDKKCQWMS